MNLNTLNSESLSLIRIRIRSRSRIRSRTRILVLVHSFSCLVAFIVVMRLGRVDGFFSALGAGGGNVDRPKMPKMLRMRMKMRRKMGRVPCKCNSSSSRGYRGGTISAINMRICIWEIRAALPPHSQFLFLLLLPLPSSSLWHFTCCAVKQKMVMS